MKVNNEKLKEHERKFESFTLEEQSSSQSKHDINWLKDEVKQVYGQWKSWVETQKDNEELQEKITKVKQRSDVLFKNVTNNVKSFCENENVKEKFDIGKDKVLTTGMNVAHLVSEGIQEVLQQENVKKVVNNIHNSIDQIRNDERVKQNVRKLKKGTLHVAESTYQGIKKALEEKEPENKDTMDNNHL